MLTLHASLIGDFVLVPLFPIGQRLHYVCRLCVGVVVRVATGRRTQMQTDCAHLSQVFFKNFQEGREESMSFRWQNNHKKKKQFNQKVVKTTNKQTGDSCWLLFFLLMRFLLLQSEAPYCSPKAITTLCLTVDSRSTFGKHLEQANQNRHKSSDSPLLISCISFYNWN